MLFDLHVHTNYSSCSHLTVNDLLDQATAIGLDGVCVTDHDNMHVKELLSQGFQKNGLFVVIGFEYSTPQGDFLIFGLDDVPLLGLSAQKLLQLVKKNNAVAVSAHPYRKGRSTSEQVFSEGWCQIAEFVNGRNSDEENVEAADKLSKYSLVQCGGSDAHSREELGAITTKFTTPIKSIDDFIQALKAGFCIPHVYCKAN